MTRPRAQPPEQKRWPWWDQTRDALAVALGAGLAILEAVRGTYNPVAMGLAATFVLGAAAGIGARKILGGGNGP